MTYPHRVQLVPSSDTVHDVAIFIADELIGYGRTVEEAQQMLDNDISELITLGYLSVYCPVCQVVDTVGLFSLGRCTYPSHELRGGAVRTWALCGPALDDPQTPRRCPYCGQLYAPGAITSEVTRCACGADLIRKAWVAVKDVSYPLDT